MVEVGGFGLGGVGIEHGTWARGHVTNKLVTGCLVTGLFVSDE